MSSLNEIAAQMQSAGAADPGKIIGRKLSKGLRLRLIREETRWRLSAIREGVWPSDDEVNVLKECFGIGDSHNVGTGMETVREVDFYIIRIVWSAAIQPSLFDQAEVTPAETAEYYKEA